MRPRPFQHVRPRPFQHVRPQENADGNADDEEAGLREVRVEIHTEILEFKYKRMQFIWESHLDSSVSRLSIEDQQKFFFSTEHFHTVVFDGMKWLVNVHRLTMLEASDMAEGKPATSSRPQDLKSEYLSVQESINRFLAEDWGDTPWGKSCNDVRDKILAEFNENTQLLVRYLELLPLIWEMADKARVLTMGLNGQKTGALSAFLGFVMALGYALLLDETESIAQIDDSREIILELRVFVPWKDWNLKLKILVCFASACALIFLIWFIFLLVRPDSCRWLRNCFDREKRRALKRYRELEKSIGDAWPSDLCKETFDRKTIVNVNPDMYQHWSDERKAFEREAVNKRVTRCIVKIPVERIIRDPPVVAIGRRLQQEERRAA
ncbi:hypothetical protein PUMCH_000608 [Australozyma saopauloensis]|uniref:Uncharacterized protein n=1 Tax=Australozyma saopauloensis TaxID=291208 RepID=A0AAX4H6H5_9ASCO|nr:hypothetical protein PUMCH_000608 [[Candida] saopauloensis]